MIRTVITLCILLLLTSVASAEVYKWEDANGIHFTDSPASVPEKYREKVYAETREQIQNTAPANVGVTHQDSAIHTITPLNQISDYQANLEQQRQGSEAQRQQQARALAESTKNLDNSFQSLARYMAIWLLIGFAIFIVWVLTIVDVIRSEFTVPSNKTVWLLLVMLLPLLGILLYYIFGLTQKCSSIGYQDNYQKECLARLKPRDPKDRDFIIQ